MVGETPHLRVRLQQLEQKIDQLAEVVTVNTEVFAAGFEASDRRVFALMRITQEIALGQKPIYKGNSLDWDQYYTEYHATMALIRLAEVHGPAAMIPEEKDEGQDEHVLVFGGDA